MEVVTHLPQTM